MWNGIDYKPYEWVVSIKKLYIFIIHNILDLSIKLFLKQVELSKNSKTSDNKQIAQKILSSAYSLIDKGCKKKVFHKNTAARKKSQLALALKTI